MHAAAGWAEKKILKKGGS